jgi:Bacterial regulatory proteins, luxR family
MPTNRNDSGGDSWLGLTLEGEKQRVFTHSEVEDLLLLARAFVDETSSRPSLRRLLSLSHRLLDANCCTLSLVKPHQNPRNGVSVELLGSSRAEARLANRAARIVSNSVAQRLQAGDSHICVGDIWHTDGREPGIFSGALVAGPALLAVWGIDVDGSYLILSAHRFPESHQFQPSDYEACRMLMTAAEPKSPHPLKEIKGRLHDVLHELQLGRSEKEAANSLRLSPHTVHIYIKTLYRKFKVNSRAELLCRTPKIAARGISFGSRHQPSRPGRRSRTSRSSAGVGEPNRDHLGSLKTQRPSAAAPA